MDIKTYMNTATFSKRLAILIGLDMVLAMVDSYVPHGIWPVRDALAMLELSAMALTMAVTLRRVLEDY
jgi:hypothetical protein